MNKNVVVPIVDTVLLVIALILLVFVMPVKTFTLIPAILFLVIGFMVQMMPVVLPVTREMPFHAGLYVLDGIYLVAQMVFSFLAVSIFAFRLTFVWTVCTVMFLMYLAVMLLFRSTMLAEVKRAGDEKQKRGYMKQIILMLEQSSHAAMDEEIKKEISAVLESMKYSDPNSSDELMDIETEIFDTAESLLEQIQCNRTMDAKESCSILQNKIIKRNSMCKMYKR